MLHYLYYFCYGLHSHLCFKIVIFLLTYNYNNILKLSISSLWNIYFLILIGVSMIILTFVNCSTLLLSIRKSALFSARISSLRRSLLRSCLITQLVYLVSGPVLFPSLRDWNSCSTSNSRIGSKVSQYAIIFFLRY